MLGHIGPEVMGVHCIASQSLCVTSDKGQGRHHPIAILQLLRRTGWWPVFPPLPSSSVVLLRVINCVSLLCVNSEDLQGTALLLLPLVLIVLYSFYTSSSSSFSPS